MSDVIVCVQDMLSKKTAELEDKKILIHHLAGSKEEILKEVTAFRDAHIELEEENRKLKEMLQSHGIDYNASKSPEELQSKKSDDKNSGNSAQKIGKNGKSSDKDKGTSQPTRTSTPGKVILLNHD